VGSETVLAEIPDPTDRPPLAVWSPDGEQAAIVGGTQVGKFPSQVGDNLFAVNRHGKVTQLTHLAEQFGEGVNVHSLSWSPDSRHVAFWLWRPGMEPFQWGLAILDTTTGAITDYCISTNPYAANRAWWAGLSAPIWSPDSNQLVVEHWTDDAKDVILLDADQGIAYRLAQNMAPIGWMTSE
jgi:Tol biopolymer transport system component